MASGRVPKTNKIVFITFAFLYYFNRSFKSLSLKWALLLKILIPFRIFFFNNINWVFSSPIFLYIKYFLIYPIQQRFANHFKHISLNKFSTKALFKSLDSIQFASRLHAYSASYKIVLFNPPFFHVLHRNPVQ